MTPKGFLLVLMQPPPAFEEEFNAWYDTEHVPERVGVAGFETGLRYICPNGSPRYLAMYDMRSPDVLDSPEYLRVSFGNASPWTKRVTGRVRVYRSGGRQIYPGDALTRPAARVLLLRFRNVPADAHDAIVSGMRANFEGRRETLQVRVFAHDTGNGFDVLGMVEACAPTSEAFEVEPFGDQVRALDLVNTYVPY